MSALTEDVTARPRRIRAARPVGVVLSGGVLLLVVLMAVVPSLFTSADPLATDLSAALSPPSGAHFFGTDQTGRDIFTRVVHGARLSLGIGLAATAIAAVAGLVLGIVVGFAPRPVSTVSMRLVDVLLAFPEFLVALVVVAILGPGPVTVAVGVTIAAVPVYLRLARAQTLTLRDAEHVEAARLLGIPRPIAALRHVVPAVASSLSVLATIGVGSAILAAAGLSFLGLGPTEPTPEWGLMLTGGRNVLGQAWWVAVFPGVAITATVVSLSVIGRALRTRFARGSV
jgi:peptide/nickel transport system permease protein